MNFDDQTVTAQIEAWETPSGDYLWLNFPTREIPVFLRSGERFLLAEANLRVIPGNKDFEILLVTVDPTPNGAPSTVPFAQIKNHDVLKARLAEIITGQYPFLHTRRYVFESPEISPASIVARTSFSAPDDYRLVDSGERETIILLQEIESFVRYHSVKAAPPILNEEPYELWNEFFLDNMIAGYKGVVLRVTGALLRLTANHREAVYVSGRLPQGHSVMVPLEALDDSDQVTRTLDPLLRSLHLPRA